MLELKPEENKDIAIEAMTFNRTMLELKHYIYLMESIYLSSFNRTMLELKL